MTDYTMHVIKSKSGLFSKQKLAHAFIAGWQTGWQAVREARHTWTLPSLIIPKV